MNKFSLMVRALVAAATLVGCTQKPATIDTSQQINSGVNILPEAVVASLKETPSKKLSSSDVPDLIEVMSDSQVPHYKLIELLRTAKMVPTLQQVGPYTIFAPTDDAFNKLPPGVLDRLMLPSHRAELVHFLNYHLLKGRIDTDALQHTDGQVPTLAGPSVVIKGIGGKVMVKDANVLSSEASASNGIVHWIDNVLLPPVTTSTNAQAQIVNPRMMDARMMDQ
jgi:uncharacterized surface protein with fasciclin (FAS1) repeats